MLVYYELTNPFAVRPRNCALFRRLNYRNGNLLRPLDIAISAIYLKYSVYFCISYALCIFGILNCPKMHKHPACRKHCECHETSFPAERGETYASTWSKFMKKKKKSVSVEKPCVCFLLVVKALLLVVKETQRYVHSNKWHSFKQMKSKETIDYVYWRLCLFL